MYIKKTKRNLFLKFIHSSKFQSMKIFKANFVYLSIAAFIFLQVPILIAGSGPDYSKKSILNTSKPVEKNKAEIIIERADSIYNSIQLVAAGLNEQAFELAYTGYNKLIESGMVGRPEIITIADFSKASNEKRLYVINLLEGKLLFHTLVAHGRNSGTNYATEFSNKPSSYKSSLGFYLTLDPYIGDNGYSLKLEGLEKGINDKAYSRAIVIHGSDYVSDQIANNGTIGRSFGCPAVPLKQSKSIINTVKKGSVLFIYHPNKNYLNQSDLLKS